MAVDPKLEEIMVDLKKVGQGVEVDYSEVISQMTSINELYSLLDEKSKVFLEDQIQVRESFSRNKETLEALTKQIEKLPASLKSVEAVQGSTNLSFEKAVELLEKQLKASKNLGENLNQIEKEKNSEIDAHITNLNKLQKKYSEVYAQMKADAVKAADEAFKQIEKSLSLESFLQRKIGAKGSIIGSLMGNVDPNDLLSVMMGRFSLGAAGGKLSQMISGQPGINERQTMSDVVVKGMDNASVFKSMDSVLKEVSENTDKTAAAVEETNETGPDKQTKKIQPLLAPVLATGITSAGNIGGAFARSGLQAWGGPEGLAHAISRPLLSITNAISPKLAGNIGSMLDLVFKTLTMTMETGIMSRRASQIASVQAGHRVGLGSASLVGSYLTRQEYVENVERGSRLGVGMNTRRVASLAGLGLGWGQEGVSSLDSMLNTTGKFEGALTRTMRIFAEMGKVSKESSLSVHKLAEWTSQAASNARFLNVDYKIVAATMKQMGDNTARLATLGVNVRQEGGAILNTMMSARKEMDLGVKAYIGMRMGAKDVFQGIGWMTYGKKAVESGAIGGNIDESGQLQLRVRKGDYSDTATTKDMLSTLKKEAGTIASQIGLFDKSGKLDTGKLGIFQSMLANNAMFQGFDQKSLITLLTTNVDKMNDSTIKEMGRNFKDPAAHLKDLTGMAGRTEKIQQGIGKMVLSILTLMVTLPDALAVRLNPLSSIKERAIIDRFYEEQGNRIISGAKDVASVGKEFFQPVINMRRDLKRQQSRHTGGVLPAGVLGLLENSETAQTGKGEFFAFSPNNDLKVNTSYQSEDSKFSKAPSLGGSGSVEKKIELTLNVNGNILTQNDLLKSLETALAGTRI